jgi:hypothetical protein
MNIKETHQKELENLLSLCEPKSLRRTIQLLYFSVTMEKSNKNLLPEDFDEISTDVFYLLEFIEKLDELHTINN